MIKRIIVAACMLVLWAGIVNAQSDPLPPADAGMMWQQTFGDEFNGTSVDTTKWNGLYGGGTPWCATCPQDYSNLVEGNGVLQMTGSSNPHGINTYGKFFQRYGYFSARVKNPHDDGNTWYAGLWSFAVPHAPPPPLPCNEGFEEFDMDESGYAVSGTSDTASSNSLHDQCFNGPLVNGAAATYFYPQNGTDLSADYHVYGWQWRNDGSAHGTFQGFFDGTPTSAPLPTGPGENQWDSGIYLLSGMQPSTVGSVMSIDWIHAYQQVPITGTPTPTATATATPTATPTPTGCTASISSPANNANVVDPFTVTITESGCAGFNRLQYTGAPGNAHVDFQGDTTSLTLSAGQWTLNDTPMDGIGGNPIGPVSANVVVNVSAGATPTPTPCVPSRIHHCPTPTPTP